MMKLYPILSLLSGFCLILITAISTPQKLGKLIIDTDAGGDDAGAILIALAAEQQLNKDGLEIIAITCTYGNTIVTNVETNVLKILTIANRSDIPVYVGAHKPLLRNFTLDNFYGEDGFGDFDFDEEILGHSDRSKHASLALVDLARQHAGKVSIMALGPLTNVALAITLDPNFINNIDQFYIMGSSVRGLGNVAPNVEFNFHQDPQSNFIVLNGTRGPPAILFPWETSIFASIPVEWRKEVLGMINSRTMKYLNKIESKSLKGPLWKVADLMLSALVLWPEFITSSLVTNLTPVFDGAAEGSVLIDYANTTGKSQNVKILEAFDVEGFKEFLLEIFSRD